MASQEQSENLEVLRGRSKVIKRASLQGDGEVSLGEEVNASIELCAKPYIFERLASLLMSGVHKNNQKKRMLLASETKDTQLLTVLTHISCCIFPAASYVHLLYLSGSLEFMQVSCSCCRSQTIIAIINHIATSGCAIQSQTCIWMKTQPGLTSIQQNCCVCRNTSVLYIYSGL